MGTDEGLDWLRSWELPGWEQDSMRPSPGTWVLLGAEWGEGMCA